jgi:hypothetical protein
MICNGLVDHGYSILLSLAVAMPSELSMLKKIIFCQPPWVSRMPKASISGRERTIPAKLFLRSGLIFCASPLPEASAGVPAWMRDHARSHRLQHPMDALIRIICGE